MKRNLFPLLGIAFVVAIAATGIFYGLFVGRLSASSPGPVNPTGVVVAKRHIRAGTTLSAEDVQQDPGRPRPEGSSAAVSETIGKKVLRDLTANEPVPMSSLAGPVAVNGMTIPRGMRAISIRVNDSAGLLPFVRPGQKIDLQTIQGQGANAVARVLLNDVEVLGPHTETGTQNTPGTVLNLLVAAADVERVALADSAARIRIVLRSSDEHEQAPQLPGPAPEKPVQKSTAFGASLPLPLNPFASSAAQTPTAGEPVHFQVQMAIARPEILRDLPPIEGGIRICVTPKAWNANDLHVITTETLQAPHWHEVAARTTSGGDHSLSVRVTPRGESSSGELRLRIRPELSLPQRGGISSRKFSADVVVPHGQSVLVTGFEQDTEAPSLARKLLSEARTANTSGQLLVLVTPQPKSRRER